MRPCPCCGSSMTRVSITPDGIDACVLCRRGPWHVKCGHCVDHCRCARPWNTLNIPVGSTTVLMFDDSEIRVTTLAREWAQGTAD